MKTVSKKLGAIVLALAMCMSLCCTALVSAADENTYTITVSNTTQGYTYAAYKIFDATVALNEDGSTKTDEDGNPIVAYYITEANPWFQIITDGYPVDPDTGVYETKCFKLTPTGTAAGYTVQVADNVTDADILAFFNDQIKMTENPEGSGKYELTAPEGVDPVKTGQGNGGTLVLDVSEGGAGYYFVTSTMGSTVTITTTDPKATVIDKNTPPGNLDKQMTTGLEMDSEDDAHADADTIGNDVKFEVTADVPLYAPGDDENPEGYLVTDYVFDDEMTVGLEIRGLTQNDYTIDSDGRYWATDSLINSWVKLTDNTNTYTLTNVAYNVKLELIYPSEYNDVDGSGTQFDGFILTYDTVPDKDELDGTTYGTAAEINTKYPVNASIEIDYTAHITGEVDYDNINHIDMYWHLTTFVSPKFPVYTGHEEDEDDVYVLELEITKLDAETQKELAGAEFQLTGTKINEVITTTTYTFDPLDKAAYDEAYAEGKELWFEVNESSGISFTSSSGKFYTNVNPYEIIDELGDEADLSNYVSDGQEYATEDYHYVAYTLTVTHDTVQKATGDDRVVTGTTGSDGKLRFVGITVGDWTLTEIKAPDGYNLLPEDLEFTISVEEWNTDPETGKVSPVFECTSSDDIFTFDTTTGIVSISVDNNAGTELPGTGGIGTTIFYIIGGVLVVGAVVVLVTRRRMTREG